MEPARVRPEVPPFWVEVASTPGGESIATCIPCEACSSPCPIGALDPGFSLPRIIGRVKAGRRQETLAAEDLWTCTRCYACAAGCPRHARPGEILGALRQLALRAGADGPGPRRARALGAQVRERGRIDLATRGKPSPRRARPAASSAAVRGILDAAEAS